MVVDSTKNAHIDPSTLGITMCRRGLSDFSVNTMQLIMMDNMKQNPAKPSYIVQLLL